MVDQWTFIERAGRELGASAEVVRKWRSRGVSHPWRVPLIEFAEREDFALDRAAFDNPPGPKRAELSSMTNIVNNNHLKVELTQEGKG